MIQFVALFKYWRALLVGAVLLAVAFSYFYGYGRGVTYQKALSEAESARKAHEGRETFDAIEMEIMIYTDEDLDKELENWYRD